MATSCPSVRVNVAVTICVDPTNGELLSRFDRAKGPSSIGEVVRDEIVSNLESVSYVQHVTVTSTERR